VTRWKNVVLQSALYQTCRRLPQQMRRLLMAGVKRQLPEGFDVEKHFGPRYNPWDQRLWVKYNLGPPPEAMSYRLVGSGEHGVARVQWEGSSTHTARELLAEQSADTDKDDVDLWLTSFLKAGRQPSNEVYAAADAAGYSKDKAKRAKARLAIAAIRDGQKGTWYWSLPQGSTTPPESPTGAPLLPCSLAGQQPPQCD
jgi:hypothetical protein